MISEDAKKKNQIKIENMFIGKKQQQQNLQCI